MTDKTKFGVVAGATAGFGVGLGYLFQLDPDMVSGFLSATANSQIAQAGFFFTLAAWLHSGRVKKEIKINFQALTDAINNVAVTLRQDLERQGEVLANHGQRLENLEKSKGG